MAYPHEDAKAICLSTYSLFYKLLGIDGQIKKFDQVKRDTELTNQTVTIEDTFGILDTSSTLKIKVTNDGRWNYVKISVAGKEFESFELENDSEEILPEFEKRVSSHLKPIIDHIKKLLGQN